MALRARCVLAGRHQAGRPVAMECCADRVVGLTGNPVAVLVILGIARPCRTALAERCRSHCRAPVIPVSYKRKGPREYVRVVAFSQADAVCRDENPQDGAGDFAYRDRRAR